MLFIFLFSVSVSGDLRDSKIPRSGAGNLAALNSVGEGEADQFTTYYGGYTVTVLEAGYNSVVTDGGTITIEASIWDHDGDVGSMVFSLGNHSVSADGSPGRHNFSNYGGYSITNATTYYIVLVCHDCDGSNYWQCDDANPDSDTYRTQNNGATWGDDGSTGYVWALYDEPPPDPDPEINFSYINSTSSNSGFPVAAPLVYDSGEWNFTFNVSDNNLDTVTVSLINSSSLQFQTNFSGGDINFSLAVFNFSGLFLQDFGGNPFNLSVWANDTTGSSDYDSYLFNVTDSVDPVCMGFINDSILNNSYYNFSAICSDESFFSLNVSCDNGFNFYEDGLDTDSYNFTNSTLILSDTSCIYRACDGHTLSSLSRDSFHTLSEEKVSYHTLSGIHRVNVSFYPLSSGVDKVSVWKEKDRIRFEYVFNKSVKGPKSFIYRASDRAVYIPSDKYKGWIVDPVSNTWFDSNLANDPGARVDVERVSYEEYQITVFSDSHNLVFESIGELNCISGSFDIDLIPVFSGKDSFDSVQEAIYYLGVLAFWIALIVIMFQVRGLHGRHVALFNMLQLLFGLWAGVLWYRFSFFLGLPIFAAAISVFYGFIVSADN